MFAISLQQWPSLHAREKGWPRMCTRKESCEPVSLVSLHEGKDVQRESTANRASFYASDPLG